jgi:hypothetical protein
MFEPFPLGLSGGDGVIAMELLSAIRGELAAILRLSGCANEKAPAFGPELLAEQIKMVAGARNHRELTLTCPI